MGGYGVAARFIIVSSEKARGERGNSGDQERLP